KRPENDKYKNHQFEIHESFLTMNRLLVSVLLPVLFSSVSYSQIHWQKVDSMYQPLSNSIHIFRSKDSVNGKPFIAYYLSAKLKDKRLLFTAQTGNGHRYTPSQYYRQEQFPIVVVNCAFFSIVTNQNLSVIIKNGKLVSRNITSLKGLGKDSALFYYVTRSAIGIDKNRNADISWTFTTSSKHRVYAFENGPVITKNEYTHPDIFDLKDVDWKWWKMQTAVGGGPTLIHDGEIRITNKEEEIFSGEEKLARTAMGYTKDNRLIILVIQGGNAEGATFEREAKMLKDIGCYEALNLDGGKNSCMLVNGIETISPSEKTGETELPAVFMIKSP
ncbi:MAG TPA: phosphodiester glycosidase family protein, partial [Puia sp.]|nr:phosphodiester glycosidase family protein [Puia sp.]